MKKALLLLLIAGSVVVPGAVAAQDRITGRAFASRSEVIATQAMAATSHPLATQAALDIMQAGGSALDAAVAANAVLGLMEPTGCGIGGDLFAIVWDPASRKLWGLNGSGRAPALLDLEVFRRRGLDRVPSHGPLPVTVPGAVDGWFELHDRFGNLPMMVVLAPAIRYAREGFPVTELIAYYWQRSVPVLEKWPGFRQTFMPGGRAPGKGDVFRNPRLAATYEAIATGGREVFYRGPIARAIDKYMRENDGYLRYEDLAAHRSEWVEPVSTTYRGYTVWELPPNGQGIAALQMLNLLEGYDVAAMGFGSAAYIHHLVEAKKLAFEDRARFYADPAFNTIPVETLISKEYALRRRALIDPARAARVVEPGTPLAGDGGDTIYLTTADRSGMMVSLIQSNYRGMGSGMTPGDLGFILQDRGELFDLTEGRFNTLVPGKRPFHTIIPAFVTRDGRPYMSFGVMGGATQPQAHVQILVNMIDFGMNLQEAGDAPRIVHSGSSQPTGERMSDGGEIWIESGVPYESVRELVKMGHRVTTQVGPFGGYQAILWDAEREVFFGASESRKDGQAAGF